MFRLNEHNILNKLVDVEKITRSLVLNAILSIDQNVALGAGRRIVIVGGKCFDIAFNKNILEFLNAQHINNIQTNNGVDQMNQLMLNNDLSKFLTSSDVDVHLVSPNNMSNADFMLLTNMMATHINNTINTNNYDYFNSVLKSYGVRIVRNGNNFIKVVKPTVKKLEFIKLNRMYIEFEFINTLDQATLQQLEIFDPTFDTNIRILPNSRIRLYIFDIVFERENHNIDGVIDSSMPQFVLNRSVQLPGYTNIYTLGMYDMLSQIYHLIKAKSNKLARNIIRFAMAIIFARNHYLSPTGIKMCLNDRSIINNFIIDLLRNGHLNKILNMSRFNILIKGGLINQLAVDPNPNIYCNDTDNIVARYRVRPYRCTNCNTFHYKEMIYGKYDDNYRCCPFEARNIDRQHLYNHVLADLSVENITVFDYYGLNYPANPDPTISNLIANRKSPIMINDIRGEQNIIALRNRFNMVNVIRYNTVYYYNIGIDRTNVVLDHIILPRSLKNISSKKTITTYIPTFLFLENSLINHCMFQTYNSANYDQIAPTASGNQLNGKLPQPGFANSQSNTIINDGTQYTLDYVGVESPNYNNKCRNLFVANTNDNFLGRVMTGRNNVEQLQKYLIFGSRFNRSNYIAVHNNHNSFITFSGQYLPITRVKNTDRFTNANTVDDIPIGSEIIYNSFQSTSCRLLLSYEWRNNSTDVCYMMRTNLNNPLNNNAIYSIISNGINIEMEIIFGFGNRFVIIDKFLTHSVGNRLNNLQLNDEEMTDRYQNLDDLYRVAFKIFNNITKEKKIPVIDTNGSYLNNPISKTYTSQIVAFQSFLNNDTQTIRPSIGISKQMPNILYNGYVRPDPVPNIPPPAGYHIINSCTDHKLISLFRDLTGNGLLNNPTPNTWVHSLNNNVAFGQNYVRRQLKLAKYNDPAFNNPANANIMIRNNMNLAFNENIITLVLSEATRKRILYCYPQLLDFYYGKNLNCAQRVSLPNQPAGSPIDIINSTMVI